MIYDSMWDPNGPNGFNVCDYSERWLNGCLETEIESYFLSEKAKQDFFMATLRIEKKEIRDKNGFLKTTIYNYDYSLLDMWNKEKIISLIPQAFYDEIESYNISAEMLVMRKFVQAYLTIKEYERGTLDAFGKYLLYRMCLASDTKKKYRESWHYRFIKMLTEYIFAMYEQDKLYGVKDVFLYLKRIKEYYTNAKSIVTVWNDINKEQAKYYEFKGLLSGDTVRAFDDFGFFEGMKYIQYDSFNIIGAEFDQSYIFKSIHMVTPNSIREMLDVFMQDTEKTHRILAESIELPDWYFQISDKEQRVYIYEKRVNRLFVE